MKTEQTSNKGVSFIEHDYVNNQIMFPILKSLEKTPLAWKILHYASYLSCDFINMDILKELISLNEEELQKSLKRLVELNLVVLLCKNGVDGVCLHNSVRESVKNYAKMHHQSFEILKLVNLLYKNDPMALPLKELLQDRVHQGNVMKEAEIYARIKSVKCAFS